MNHTDLNTIYTWFEEGDFPTAQQFQATFSSFYHKGGKIPMGNVEGLNNALGKYVLKSTFASHIKDDKAHVKHLVKLDATNITEEYRELLRKALGIGDLPSNIATTDYVDANAKNVANSVQRTKQDAKMILDHPWEIDANNQPLVFKNLQNAEGDEMFNIKFVMKPDGTVGGKPDVPGIEINIPEVINNNLQTSFNVTLNNPTNNVSIPTAPEYEQELNDFMTTIRENDLIPITADKWSVKTYDNEDYHPSTLITDDYIRLRHVKSSADAQDQSGMLITATANIEFPLDKNFVFTCNNLTNANVFRATKLGFGIERALSPLTESSFTIKRGDSNSLGCLFYGDNSLGQYRCDRMPYLGIDNTITFVKVGSVIYLIADFHDRDRIISSSLIPTTATSLRIKLTGMKFNNSIDDSEIINKTAVSLESPRYWIEE